MFHPVKGCLKRLKEHEHDIETNFQTLRTNFAKGFPACGTIPAVPTSTLNAILSEVLANAPKRLSELRTQLADCIHWELQRYGPHTCGETEVSEDAIRALHLANQ